MTTSDRSYLRAPHLLRSRISVAVRVACLELGQEWREREVVRLARVVAEDPALQKHEAAPPIETPPAPPALEETAAVPEALYVQHAALWNMRVDQRRARRAQGGGS